MSTLKPGWCDEFTKQYKASPPEKKYELDTGYKRRSWRGNLDISQKSRLRGAHSKGKSKVLERVLGPAIEVDE